MTTRPSAPAEMPYEALRNKVRDLIYAQGCTSAERADRIIDLVRATLGLADNQTPSAIHKSGSDQQAIHKAAPADAKELAEKLQKTIVYNRQRIEGGYEDSISPIDLLTQALSAAHQRGYGEGEIAGLEKAAILAKRDYTSRCGHVVLAQASKKADALANAIRALRKADREGGE